MKNSLTPAGIEPATFRFVAQHLNHCATAVPFAPAYAFVKFANAVKLTNAKATFNKSFTNITPMYRGADKFLARPGRKQSNVSFRMAFISFGALPCRKRNFMTARVSLLLKSRASLTSFRVCFLPGRAKDLSAPLYFTLNSYFLIFFYQSYPCNKDKGIAVPLQACTCPEVSRRLRLPDFKTIGTWRL